MKTLFLLLAAVAASASAQPAQQQQLWLYYPTNLLVDQNLDKAKDLWTRAAALGYDHVLLADSKFNKLGDMDKHYFANIEKAKKLAADLKLELVPAMFAVGYSNDLLWHDPNLADGLPVKAQPFIVKAGNATPVNDISLPTKPGYHDANVTLADGVASLKNPDGNARVSFNLKLPPFRAYHVSVKIKTDDFHGSPEIKAIASSKPNRNLQWQNIHVKPTQDWTTYDVVFNTLDSEGGVTLYFGLWGGGKGSLQWKDWTLEESGLVNVLRRPGCPVTVTTDDGQPLAEGQDYDPVIDPNLGNHPWKGEYNAYHAPVPLHLKRQLADGTKLKVSWFHPAIIYDGQVSGCIAEPTFNDLLKDQAQRMTAAWGTRGYMMSHDEFRTLGWDDACSAAHTHKTPGQQLADNVRFCTSLLAGSDVYVWNDMFDPFHNAVDAPPNHPPYYLVNGPWTDSWLGLDPKVTVVNWNFGHRDESLKFFADRGHKQLIAAYYDGPMANTKKWVDSAAKTPNVVGFMYTTWRNDYKDIEAFAKTVRPTK